MKRYVFVIVSFLASYISSFVNHVVVAHFFVLCPWPNLDLRGDD
jgi:hypothetical protein